MSKIWWKVRVDLPKDHPQYDRRYPGGLLIAIEATNAKEARGAIAKSWNPKWIKSAARL
jgi:hypothetical protein